MILLILLILLINNVNSYMYPVKLKSRISSKILEHDNLQKDIIKINEFDAQYITNYWYEQSKKKNIDINLKDFAILSTDICEDYKNENEYIVWKPNIKIFLPNKNLIQDNYDFDIIVPEFKETICLICYQNNKNSIQVINFIKSPFWCDENNYLNKKIKLVLFEYFINFLKHSNIKYN